MAGYDENWEVVKLLRTGDLSDVTVICNDIEWKLHKEILSSRCPWFKRALQDDPENEVREIIIDANECVLYSLIEWIYTKKFFNELQPTGEFSHARIYKAAEKFELPDLMKYVQGSLEEILCNKAKFWQIDFHDTDFPEEIFTIVAEGDHKEVMGQIVEAYKLGCKGIQRVWVQFMEATMFWPMGNDMFDELFREVPAYADDVMSCMMDRDYVPAVEAIAERCEECGWCPLCDLDYFFVKVWKENNGETKGLCNLCSNEWPSLLGQPDLPTTED
ncbi:hypothetical protein F4805DRAFT_474475 [Annulohypoxylon moriforme]|nr:hypothetical protein F4805DRAFT_474475 [Annulohypoxylon moriforme]